MIERLGIVPAGGISSRWNGYYKEFLPIENGKTLLDRTIESMKYVNVDLIVLITSQTKINIHTNYLKNNVIYQINTSPVLWDGIFDLIKISSERYYFAMPDTYFNTDIFSKMSELDFNIGYFETEESERFGVITNNGIVDKQSLEGTQKAWGVLSWSYRVAEFWQQNIDKIDNHTQAFNMAMNNFEWSATKLDYYYDIANYEYYKRLINGI